MKRWASGQILAVIGLTLFLIRIATTAQSAADWEIGLALLAAALLVAWWLIRFDRPASGSTEGKIAPPTPVTAGNTFVTGEVAAPVEAVPLLVCSACGARSTGGKFCSECGEPFHPRNACPQCGTQFEGGAKFCNGCGTKLD